MFLNKNKLFYIKIMIHGILKLKSTFEKESN